MSIKSTLYGIKPDSYVILRTTGGVIKGFASEWELSNDVFPLYHTNGLGKVSSWEDVVIAHIVSVEWGHEELQ